MTTDIVDEQGHAFVDGHVLQVVLPSNESNTAERTAVSCELPEQELSVLVGCEFGEQCFVLAVSQVVHGLKSSVGMGTRNEWRDWGEFRHST